MLLEESRYIEQYLEARWALYYGYISNAHITSQSHAFFLKENDLNHIAHPFTFLLLTPVIYLHYIQVFFLEVMTYTYYHTQMTDMTRKH